MMTGTPKTNTATLKALSEPSTQHSFGVAPPALASLEASVTTGLESNTQELFTYTPSFDPDRSYSPGPCIPTCHNTGSDDWTITTRTACVLLGDANINIFPSHPNPDLQIDSYPSANFRKFYKLFKRTVPNPTTETVILAVGLNDMTGQDPKITGRQLKDMQRSPSLTPLYFYPSSTTPQTSYPYTDATSNTSTWSSVLFNISLQSHPRTS
ncbi:uncharacterized protein LOC141775864 [Sebastes fasciatus]|uniref:uncharacterized protein LOC141775864 n=1 Tax=Sebastes fasciatus TaxID=394691 RepID=UPI003D9F8DE2